MQERSDQRRADVFELFREYTQDVAQRLSPKTGDEYRYHVLKAFSRLVEDPRDISDRAIDDFLKDHRPQYAKIIKCALSDFFGFLVRRGHRARNPLDNIIVRPRGGKRVKRGLEKEELVRLLIAAVASSHARFDGTRLAWQILAQYALGLRPGELIRLIPERIRLNGSSSAVEVTDTKTGNDRLVPVNRIAREALTELLKDGKAGNIVRVGTTQYWYHVRRAAQMANLSQPKSRPYALRHTFATHLIERGVPARVAAELLGHSDMRAIWGYTVAADRTLREAIEELDEP